MKTNFKVGNLVRVLPDTDPGFTDEKAEHDYHRLHGVPRVYPDELWGLLGIVTQITDRRTTVVGDIIQREPKHVLVRLQNGLNNIYYYESELEKVAE